MQARNTGFKQYTDLQLKLKIPLMSRFNVLQISVFCVCFFVFLVKVKKRILRYAEWELMNIHFSHPTPNPPSLPNLITDLFFGSQPF